MKNINNRNITKNIKPSALGKRKYSTGLAATSQPSLPYPGSSDSKFAVESNTSLNSDTIFNNAIDTHKFDNNLTFSFLNSIENLINNLNIILLSIFLIISNYF